MRYDVIFIVAGLACLVMGEGFGIWMAAGEDFTLAPAHAHLNLVGWVTLCLYGLMHRAFPALATARLAGLQCLAAIAGALTMPPGIAMVILDHTNTMLVTIASLIVVLATLLFAVMFVGKAAMAKA